MLMIQGGRQRQCDGLGRRDFLAIGGLSFGAAGFSLGGLLRAEAATPGTRPGHKALINVFLGGGPPHQDLFDLKPDAPSEVRGEFRPIATNVAGIQISEVFPRLGVIRRNALVVNQPGEHLHPIHLGASRQGPHQLEHVGGLSAGIRIAPQFELMPSKQPVQMQMKQIKTHPDLRRCIQL